MTISLRPSATNDPRRRPIGKPLTPVSFSSAGGDEEAYQHSVADLTERIETLVNHTGQLYANLQDRPIAYSIQIHDLADERYRLSRPLMILVEEYPAENTVIASLPEVEAFGEGTTLAEAILNLKHAVLDLYDELTQTPSHELGDLPGMWLRVLFESIVRDKLKPR